MMYSKENRGKQKEAKGSRGAIGNKGKPIEVKGKLFKPIEPNRTQLKLIEVKLKPIEVKGNQLKLIEAK